MKLLTFCALVPLLGVRALAADTAATEMASGPAPAALPLLEPGQAKAIGAVAAGSAASAAAATDVDVATASTAAGTDPAADAPDEPVIDEEVKAESAELEQVRAAEEKAHLTEQPVVEDPAARAAARLGLESPLRQRLRDAFSRESGGPPESTGRIAGLPEIDHDLRHLQAEYDIPIEVNERVLAYVRFFQAPAVRKHFVKYLGRASKYVPVFRQVLREEGLPEDTVYLAMIESGFANLATSRAKAVGAWQFIPATGKRFGMKQDFWVDERRDPEKAARGAAKYLKELYRQTGDWRLAWAGYNAGVGKIFKARAKGQQDFWSMTRGRVLKAETKGYVPKLMAAAIIAKHHEAFGFSKEEIEAETWQEYDQVTIPHATPLSAIAEASQAPEKALLELNPELRRTCTPPRPYVMKLPKGREEAFARNWPGVADTVGKLAFAQHKVSRGESLRSIARSFKVDEVTITRMNGLRPARHIKPGTDLVIPLNALARSQGVAFASAERAKSTESKSRGQKVARKPAVFASADPGAARHGGLADEATGRSRSTVQVRAGDTLWSLAQRFGVAVDELCRWNGIRNPNRFKLQVGKALVVYPRTSRSAEASESVRVARPG
jgi:membrane-bound lytic murein transglycosylase D